MASPLRDLSLVVDFGGSATKVLQYDGTKLTHRHCLNSELYECSAAGIALLIHAIGVARTKLDRIIATGGRSSALPRSLDGTPLLVVNEIEAIGVGGLDCVNQGPALIVSIGTGTAMAVAREKTTGFDVRHVGGLGLGGGTLMGLGRLLCHVESFDDLNVLAVEGRTERLDLLVEDIVGSGIGVVPGELTAANFGKASKGTEHFDKADVAAALFTMVGQSIARLAIVLARQAEVEGTVVIGQVSENAYMREVFGNMQALFGGSFIFASEPTYRVAMGAFQVACTSPNPATH